MALRMRKLTTISKWWAANMPMLGKLMKKHQLLNFVFQNLKLDSKNLLIETCEPFTTLMDYKGWGRSDAFRTFEWNKFTPILA